MFEKAESIKCCKTGKSFGIENPVEAGVLGMSIALGQHSRLYWWVVGTLLVLPLLFVCSLVVAFFFRVGLWFFGVVLLGYLLYMVWYVPTLCKNSGATVEHGVLYWRTGAIVQTSISLRLEMILTATVYQTPLQRLLGLCTLAVRPVGAPVRLQQLEKADADALCQCIEEARHEAA